MYKIIKLSLEQDNTDILTWMALADAYEEDMNESAANICRIIVNCLKWAIDYKREPYVSNNYYTWDRYPGDWILSVYSSSLIPATIYQYLITDIEFSRCLTYSSRNDAYIALFQAWIESKSKVNLNKEISAKFTL